MMRLPKFRYFAPTSVQGGPAHQGGRGARRRVRGGRHRPLSQHEAAAADAEGRDRSRAHSRARETSGRRRRRVDRRLRHAFGDREPPADAADLPRARPRDRGDLDAPAPQHGHARGERPSRHALQLLRPELRVAPGDRLLHEEGRHDLLGGAGLAQVPRRPVGRFGPDPDRPFRPGGARFAGRGAGAAPRGALRERRNPLPHETPRRAPDGDPSSEIRRLAGVLQEAAPARRVSISRFSPSAPRCDWRARELRKPASCSEQFHLPPSARHAPRRFSSARVSISR